jgi:hypothetical protein
MSQLEVTTAENFRILRDALGLSAEICARKSG